MEPARCSFKRKASPGNSVLTHIFRSPAAIRQLQIQEQGTASGKMNLQNPGINNSGFSSFTGDIFSYDGWFRHSGRGICLAKNEFHKVRKIKLHYCIVRKVQKVEIAPPGRG